MAGTTRSGARGRRSLIVVISAAAAAAVIATAAAVATLVPGGAVASSSSLGPSTLPSASGAPATGALPTAAPGTQRPTPVPTPVLVPAPLTGVAVSPDVAARRPIAVMIDDHPLARPQSGFNAASVVWHAPAEAGIPRYMLIFGDRIPDGVGPVRSARQYYIEWAAEWKALYVHSGGSPDAIATLRAKGDGDWVYDADEFRWGNSRYMWRATDRFAPHNVYTDGKALRRLAERLGATDEPRAPAWRFGPDATPALRPDGGLIRVVYPFVTVTYRYDPETNEYVRHTCPGVCSAKRSRDPHVDRADGEVVAPKNVVILRMRFRPLNDGHPEKYRQEADNVGTGEAWIASNGQTVKGTWSKASSKAPTLLFGPDGSPATLTAGQTFVQVIPLTYRFDIRDAPGPGDLP